MKSVSVRPPPGTRFALYKVGAALHFHQKDYTSLAPWIRNWVNTYCPRNFRVEPRDYAEPPKRVQENKFECILLNKSDLAEQCKLRLEVRDADLVILFDEQFEPTVGEWFANWVNTHLPLASAEAAPAAPEVELQTSLNWAPKVPIIPKKIVATKFVCSWHGCERPRYKSSIHCELHVPPTFANTCVEPERIAVTEQAPAPITEPELPEVDPYALAKTFWEKLEAREEIPLLGDTLVEEIPLLTDTQLAVDAPRTADESVPQSTLDSVALASILNTD